MRSEQEVREELGEWEEFYQEMRQESNLEAAGKAGLAVGVLEWVLDGRDTQD